MQASETPTDPDPADKELNIEKIELRDECYSLKDDKILTPSVTKPKMDQNNLLNNVSTANTIGSSKK